MEGGRGWLVLAVVMLVGVCAALPDYHIVSQPGEAENHIEDEFVEDALEDWLYNFDTYTFMVKQDLDHNHYDDTDTADNEEEEYEDPDDEEEVEEEEEEEGDGEEEGEGKEKHFWSAPIALTLDEHGLLNPHQDYQVRVESLVAEGGSIFVTLSKYDNKSGCGVGGVTRQDPATTTTTTHLPAHTLAIGDHHNDTLINFELQDEGNSNSSQGRSEWVELSDEYWWASGRLGGGGLLSLTFTPPECGCLTLSAYYALPAGNLTLVVGPQAYPSELQMLLCVDRLAPYKNSNDYEEEADESDNEESDYTEEGTGAESSALVGRKDGSVENSSSESSGEGPRTHIVNGRPTRQRGRKAKKAAKRLAKRKRQQKRQRIRQAGRRQARRQPPRNNHRNPRMKNRRQRKHGRQAKHAWKKIQRQTRRQRKFNRRRNQFTEVPGESGISHSTEGELGDHEGHNATHPQAEEEKLVDLLLGNTTGGNTTHEHNEVGEETEAGENREGPSEMSESEDEGEGEERGAGRGRHRMNRRQRMKMRRRERKKTTHPPGIKFCCKQGVKHRKYIIIFNATEGQTAPNSCDTKNEVVTTFANHQFSISKDQCAGAFQTCCTKFTSDLWDHIKARKAARRQQRKQRRKSRRQHRMHSRKERRNHKAHTHRWQGRHQGGNSEVLVREEEEVGVPEVEEEGRDVPEVPEEEGDNMHEVMLE